MSNNKVLKLYHTGFQEIKNPDVSYGRKNADFGGGFYLSDSLDFAQKWASERKGYSTYINYYSLDLTGLDVKEFSQDEEWFNYITKNRAGYDDSLSDADVIIGPIANDTLYDTYGIITSGLIKSADALKLLSVGNKYYQINVKSEKAAKQLSWLSSRILTADEIAASREQVRREEAQFQEAFSKALTELPDFAEIDDLLS